MCILTFFLMNSKLCIKLHVCFCQVCAELRFLLSQAQLKKEEAEREVRDISSKLSRQLELAEQVRQDSMCKQRTDK